MRIAQIVDVRFLQRWHVCRAVVRWINGKHWLQQNKKKKSMANDKELKFQKIPLKMFIETLMHLHESGVKYIDLVGVPDEEEDLIGIHVQDDYYEYDEDDEDNDDDDQNGLSEEDLNTLI